MHTSRYARALAGALMLVAAGAVTAESQTPVRYAASGGYRLSGTYALDARRSDNVNSVVQTATQSMPPGRRERVAQNWLSRLNAPATIAMDVRGRTVTMMSTVAPQITFQADGVNHIETAANGRSITTNATLRSNRLIVSTSGNRGADFTATFEPVDGGLRVTRRLDSEAQQAAVQVQSFYRRVGDARWDIYTGQAHTPPSAQTYTPPASNADRGNWMSRAAEFVPDGTQLIARLETPVNADAARAGQRVTLTVQNTGPLQNATIDGVVTRVGSKIGIDFENIRLSNGRSAAYDAAIEGIRTPDGKMVRVDNSTIADARKRSTSGTVEKGAIGAGIGAIIGAIVGGKEGAAIGAVAGGAGLILMDTKTDQKLPAGTEFTISTVRR